MVIIKCKMCGGDLALTDGQSVAECEYCGTLQTIPVADNERKLIQFERAERLRKNCEFDKAAGLYEAIVTEFRQEAEAYWGLVLCKYGIEYVDDPATGKKIPTCHRSSFDSVLEDSDFEQTLENADAVARKVYRQEAKQIEDLRLEILEASATQEPYDIFICYKETDEKGDRTLDSVLAQDIYDALTDKGYRSFFARISLEDKLGQEYEPYIFAALNSAKIMLAVGTDYEYFNAVWVKNEWSRFLKLMEKDRAKHLIPCYKGIDAYDMPREFAKLQAQDLGKVGAVQDLLRGVEKILPGKNETAAEEQVVLSGNRKIEAMLERGYIALEDGDWSRADEFFEEVLNNDSKNARAYLGKTLAQGKCVSLQALVEKRISDAAKSVRKKKVSIEVDDTPVKAAMERHYETGVLTWDYINKQYEFDLTYQSETESWERICNEEKGYWLHHKALFRAIQYALSPLAEQLNEARDKVLATVNEWLLASQEHDAEEQARVQQKYKQHMADTKKKLDQEAVVEARKREVRAHMKKESCTDPNAFYTRSKKEKSELWKDYYAARSGRRKYQTKEGSAGWVGTLIYLVYFLISVGILMSSREDSKLLCLIWYLFTTLVAGLAAGGFWGFVVSIFVVKFVLDLAFAVEWGGIFFVLTAVFAGYLTISNLKDQWKENKAMRYGVKEDACRLTLLENHLSYISELQDTYIPELGSLEVNYTIKSLVDTYPDEDFRTCLIEVAYPKIGYEVQEDKAE